MRRFLDRKVARGERYRNLGALWPRIFLIVAGIVLGTGWINVVSGAWQGAEGSLLTGTIAAASLIYSLGRGQEATKDQYTLTLVAKRFDDGGYANNVRMASDLRLSGKVEPATHLRSLFRIHWVDPNDKTKRMRAAYAIVPILNYWEHVCTAYVDDRINRRIFEDLVQDLIRDLVGRYPVIIGDMRQEDGANMEHLCAVWFVLAPDDERRKLVPMLGPVPQRLCPDDKWRWSRLETALS